MEANSVVMIADNGRFNVRIVERGITTERQFRIEAFAASWAMGQSMRLAVPVVRERALADLASALPEAAPSGATTGSRPA